MLLFTVLASLLRLELMLLDEYKKALVSLEKALAETKTDIVRDATIQRFEFCVELAWKCSKKKLGSSSTAPKLVIRELAEQAIISDPDMWFDFLEARNESSHTYKEAVAERVYDAARKFLVEGKKLLGKLEKI